LVYRSPIAGEAMTKASAYVERFYYPGVLAGSLGLALGLVEAGFSAGFVLGVTSVGLGVFSFWMERRFTETARWKIDPTEVRTDILHALISNTIPTALFRALFLWLIVAASAWIESRIGAGLWPVHWPLPGQFLLALFVAEFVSYATHRGLHRSRLWPLHAVHHCSPRMYFLLSVRKHPLQAFLTYGIRLSVLWLLGVPEQTLTVLLAFTAANSYLQHSNVRMRTGALGWIFATPELHRIHHSRRPSDLDSNFGDVLIVWDVLFGTRRAPEARAGAVDVVGLPDIEVAQTWGSHLKLPFTWHRRRAATGTARPGPAGGSPAG
jgi:sterol desaturase/sphingolipid hydroxylase (fatty acid hydroxylase superfamily)